MNPNFREDFVDNLKAMPLFSVLALVLLAPLAVVIRYFPNPLVIALAVIWIPIWVSAVAAWKSE